MTTRQFDKNVSNVLAHYTRYNIVSHKAWKEGGQLYLGLKLGPDLLRNGVWGVSAVFDRDGKLIKSSCGSLRDFLFTWILMKRIETACSKPGRRDHGS